MFRLPGLEFIDSDFSLHYVGGEEPQLLDITARTELPVEFPLGPAIIPMLCEVVNQGGAGGAEFAPTLGSAKLISGPTGESPDATSGNYHWQLELAGVSPYFMRNIVDRLRTPDQGWTLRGLHLIGSKLQDASQLSVDDVRLKAWLSDRDAYLGAWPEVPFELQRHEVLRGAGLRLQLRGTVDHKLAMAFDRLLTNWYQAISGYVNGSDEYDGVGDAVPRISCGHSELSAGWDAFDFASDPVQRVLTNMLIWFHQKVAPIAAVDMAFQS